MLQVLLFALFAAPAVLATETNGGETCYFPFLFNGEMHHECITEGSRVGRLWCYTSQNYTRKGPWGYCKTEPEPTTTSAPKQCQFPFIYKGRLYETCIARKSLGQYWCSTTHNYDEDKDWIFCDNQEYWPTTAATTSAAQCHFPFVYRGVSYDECITKDNLGQYWCATTDSYDMDRKWRHCDKSEEPQCTFPFIYNGTKYSECIDIKSLGVFWCSTTDNYDTDGKWKVCKVSPTTTMEPTTTETVTSQNVYTMDDELCVFPFYYDGKKFEECTGYDSFRGKLWCSLTTDYEGKYGYCQ